MKHISVSPQMSAIKLCQIKTIFARAVGTLFYRKSCNYFLSFLAVGQVYQTRVSDVFAISGNDALISCTLPSFASEFLSVISWVTSEGHQILPAKLDGNSSRFVAVIGLLFLDITGK